jgi:5-methylcytosine-specific restriction endonuclease McrA
MINRVLVLDRNRQPLMPCHPARARKLLKRKQAAVYRLQPFTLILLHREGGDTQPLTLQGDPGSKTSGLVLVATFPRGREVLWAAELHHRGHAIRGALVKRRGIRRGRRHRHTRYRRPGWVPVKAGRGQPRPRRTHPKDWLPPSLLSRVNNLIVWTDRLRRWTPLTGLAIEVPRFDLQKLENPEITGVAYQRGTLWGYEVKEYLLYKHHHTCAYCDRTDRPLEVEHMIPVSRGGTDRLANLTLACHPCNQAKGNRTVAEFLAKDPTRAARIQAEARAPLKDAAALNALRFEIQRRLATFQLPIQVGTGSVTKFNRLNQGYPKAHWIDAACVGEPGATVRLNPEAPPLRIQALGRGQRQVCRTDAYGFPRRVRSRDGTERPAQAGRIKRVQGFQTGDAVRLKVPQGKYAGTHLGRLASIRADGRLDLKTAQGKITQNARYFTLLQRGDGYGYD